MSADPFMSIPVSEFEELHEKLKRAEYQLAHPHEYHSEPAKTILALAKVDEILVKPLQKLLHEAAHAAYTLNAVMVHRIVVDALTEWEKEIGAENYPGPVPRSGDHIPPSEDR